MDMSSRNSRGLSMLDLRWDDCSKCIGLERWLCLSHKDGIGKSTHSKLTIQTTRSMLITTIRAVSHNCGNDARESKDRLHFLPTSVGQIPKVKTCNYLLLNLSIFSKRSFKFKTTDCVGILLRNSVCLQFWYNCFSIIL